MTPSPEQQARLGIDEALIASGWVLQDRATMNLSAAPGVAVREFRMASGHGFADYLLFVNGKAVGCVEAKPAGYALTNVELQADKYATGLPARLNPPVNPLPFLYLSTGVETRFIRCSSTASRARRSRGRRRSGSTTCARTGTSRSRRSA
jgi:type I restriction enzyme R subunit